MIIGIDPDVDKSGFAIAIEGQIQSLQCKSFSDILRFFDEHKDNVKLVVIEAGWLNRTANFHAHKNTSHSASIGAAVGRNWQIGMSLEHVVLDYYGIPVKLVKPESSKLKSEVFQRITKWVGRTNQEMRDAAMLVHQRNFRI